LAPRQFSYVDKDYNVDKSKILQTNVDKFVDIPSDQNVFLKLRVRNFFKTLSRRPPKLLTLLSFFSLTGRFVRSFFLDK